MYPWASVGHIAHSDHLHQHQQSSCNGHGHGQQLRIHQQRWREERQRQDMVPLQPSKMASSGLGHLTDAATDISRIHLAKL